MVKPLMLSLNQLFDKVLAIPGVSEVLKSTIDALRAKLAVVTVSVPWVLSPEKMGILEVPG